VEVETDEIEMGKQYMSTFDDYTGVNQQVWAIDSIGGFSDDEVWEERIANQLTQVIISLLVLCCSQFCTYIVVSLISVVVIDSLWSDISSVIYRLMKHWLIPQLQFSVCM
jgi:hypothetical protein